MDQSYRNEISPAAPTTTASTTEMPSVDAGPAGELLWAQDVEGAGNAFAQDQLATQGELAADPSTEAPAFDATSTIAAFKTAWATPGRESTDAFLAELAARGATDPEAAALAADLRGWVDEKRAAQDGRTAEQRAAADRAEAERCDDAYNQSEQPEATPEEPGVWEAIASWTGDVWSDITGWWSDMGSDEAEACELEPGVEGEPERAAVAAPKEPVGLADIPAYDQHEWYGADGMPLDVETRAEVKKTLNEHGLLKVGRASDAYNDYLRLPPSERGETLTIGGEEIEVPKEIRDLPQIKFIPGESSCRRASYAMAAEAGVTPVGGSGTQDSHIQTILDSDQAPVTDADGNLVRRWGKAARDMKTTEALGPERAAQVGENNEAASAYLDAELEAGRPVVAGVSYGKSDSNSDKVTDHWVCIVGRTETGYVYNDPADGEQGVITASELHGGALLSGDKRAYTLAQTQLNTVSADLPSDVTPELTWRALAEQLNFDLFENTPEDENDRLSWKDPR